MSEQEVAPEVQEEVVQEESVETPVQEEVTEESQAEAVEVQAESEGELKEEIEDAIEDGATEEEVLSMVKQFQLKVNGKEFTRELDLNDHDAVTKELQMAAAGRGAMQEAAEIRKAYEQELMRLKQNPWEVLEELGLDSLDLSEARINKEIERQKKSPDELEREAIQKELVEAREKAAKLEKQMKDQEDSRLYEQESVKLKTEIQVALDGHTTLHATPRITRRVAETMEWAMNNGFDDVTAEDVLPTAEKQLIEEMNSMFTDFDESAIEKYIGKSNMDKMRKKRVAEVSKKPASIADLKGESAKPVAKETKARKKMKLDDFMRRR